MEGAKIFGDFFAPLRNQVGRAEALPQYVEALAMSTSQG